jgi:IS1 family transposase
VNQPDVVQQVETLVDGRCDRRTLRPLREILAVWPLTSTLTDDWAQVGDALRNVRAFAADELTDDESRTVDTLIAAVDRAVLREHS